MKVTLPKDYRKKFTLEQLDAARSIIRDMKDDESTPAEYAEYAVRHWISKRQDADYMVRVITATAETERNGMAWNAYSESTGDMDIWLNAIAETGIGFIKIGCYLSDVWSIGGDVDLTYKFFTRYYTEN